MSDTPETDAYEASHWANGLAAGDHLPHMNDLRFMRKLERERDEARAQRDAWEKVALREANKMGNTLLGGVK